MDERADHDGALPQNLVRGYENFLGGDFRRERATFHELAEKGQHPHTLVIGCCDSRVMPEEIFAAAPGEIFDVRNIANIVPPYEAGTHHSVWAAVDYALSALRVRAIVVLGHGRCGGVRAFVEGGEAKFAATAPEDALGSWIALIGPAARRLGSAPAEFCADYAENLSRESVRQSLRNLRGSPRLAALEQAGELRLHGAWFDIEDARLLALDETRDAFVQIAAPRHRAVLISTPSRADGQA